MERMTFGIYFRPTNGFESMKTLIRVVVCAVTADIVAKSRYNCDATPAATTLFRGYVLQPLPQENFAANRKVVGVGAGDKDLHGRASFGILPADTELP